MELFNNNYFFIYIWICLSIFNYSKFTDNHKVITLYFINFAVVFLHIFNYVTSILLLLISLFIFLEIFSNDTVKMIIFDKLWYKLIDYFFIIFFEYSFFQIIIELSLLNYCKNEFIKFGAISLFLLTILNITQEKFITETVSELKYKCFPSINNIDFNEIDSDIFEILIDMEDKTYHKRGNRYTFISTYFFKQKIHKIWKHKKNINQYIQKTTIVRGYSTIEMQLIRTIGIKNGFGTLQKTNNVKKLIGQYFSVIRRKIYELVYAEIFFNGLRSYYEKNVYINVNRYKDYILYIYLKYAPTMVGKTKYSNILEFIGDDPKHWTKEKCLIAYAGLPYVGLRQGLDYQKIINKHKEQINKYKLDTNEINNLLRKNN